MDILEGGPLAEIKEMYTDLLLAQLVDSSDDFREWFVNRTTSAQGVTEYNGVRCNERSGSRETDVMLGFKGLDGGDFLILLENKIKAQEQPEQLLDYHNRGESYTERGDYDQYVVCLFAPERWIRPGVEKKVDSILLYEDVMEKLETLDYDGIEFIEDVFSQSVGGATSSVADYSSTTQELWRQIKSALEIELRPHAITGNHVRCTSNHPYHPEFIIYNLYLDDTSEFGHTRLRLQIIFEDSSWSTPTNAEKQTFKRELGEAIDREISNQHPEFRGEYKNITTRKKSVIEKSLPHRDMPSFGTGEFNEELVAEFSELIEKVHPVIVDMDFEQLFPDS